MAKVKSFNFTVSFVEIQEYITKLGYVLEPVKNGGYLQYYTVQNSKIQISDEVIGKNPANGEYQTIIPKTISLDYRFDYGLGKRIYDETGLKLYRQLYRKFRKRRLTS